MISRLPLRQRLLILALSSIVVVWVVALLLTFYSTREELNELFDAHLAQVASLLSAQSMHELDEIEGYDVPLLSHFSEAVAFQVWESGTNNGTVLRLRSANAPQSMLTKRDRTGFSDVVIDGQKWRVFSSWDETHGIYLIHVAERVSDREHASGAIAYNLLLPLLLSLPLLAILLWVAITRGLRPLDKLARDVGQREPDNLSALDASSAPQEVVPLIERLNRLFIRIDASRQRERRFTADAAHELRTPVAAIKAQAQVAQAASGSAERIHAIDNAILGCDRAAHLIDQLLTLARLDALDDRAAEPCPLREIASGVIAEIAPVALEKDVHIELLEGDETTVRGNPGLLRVLLRNLVDNAVRHTPSGSAVRVNVVNRQGEVCLSVSDNGPGIPEQDRERVMERFYRPSGTQGSGSGLGLSIVKRIAEIHAATLRMVHPEGGDGLSVEVVFNTIQK